MTLYEAMEGNGLDGYALDVPVNHPIFKNAAPLHIGGVFVSLCSEFSQMFHFVTMYPTSMPT